MDRQQLAKGIFEISHLTGEFLLRSGQTSNEYFDKYRFEANPTLLAAIAKQMAPLIPHDCDLIAGLEMGGIPVATALSLETGKPMALVRKEAKDYGTCKFAEGLDLKGKKVCLIEDVVTTGGQVVESTKMLREHTGAIVENVLCVIHRGQGPATKIEEIGLKLSPLFTMEELKNT